MAKLTCPCLNISIHVKNNTLTHLDPSKLRLTDEQREVKFFAHDIADVQLDLGGISEKQHCLTRRQDVGDWRVTICINCRTSVYAAHSSKGINRVLVNNSLINNPSKQEQMMHSSDFSPLYRVLLNDHHDKTTGPTLVHPMTNNQEDLRNTVTDLQDQLNKYLNKEKAAMEDRIKKYTEEQQEKYSALQKGAYRDKNSMVGVILDDDEKSLEDSLSEAMLENALTPPRTPVSHATNGSNQLSSSLGSGGFDRTSLSRTTPARTSPTVVAPKTTPLTVHTFQEEDEIDFNRSRGSKRDYHDNQPNGDDTLFQLDEFPADCEPFFESDDESSTDDNSLNDEGYQIAPVTGRSRGNSNHQNHPYAASVPISMPTWKREKHSFEDDEEENEEDKKVPMPEPDHMVASMRALSFSVQDGTEMFGDLPRPRLNTADFVSMGKKHQRPL